MHVQRERIASSGEKDDTMGVSRLPGRCKCVWQEYNSLKYKQLVTELADSEV